MATTAFDTMVHTTSYCSKVHPSSVILNTYETSNRKLENFLFVHDIFHKSWYKSSVDGLTVWVYEDTEELRHVVAEYLAIVAKRSQRKNATAPVNRYLN